MESANISSDLIQSSDYHLNETKIISMFHGNVLENTEVKKETKEPLDDDGLVDIETYEDEPMIVDKPLTQENIEVFGSAMLSMLKSKYFYVKLNARK